MIVRACFSLVRSPAVYSGKEPWILVDADLHLYRTYLAGVRLIYGGILKRDVASRES